MSEDDLTLDPNDWDAFRARAHSLLDAAIDKMETARDGRVWTPPAADLLESFQSGLDAGADAEQLDQTLTALLPYGVGNTHPRFFGWVHGSGTPSNMLAEMVASALNANCGGRNHAAIEIEKQVVNWSKDAMGFPADASGLVTSGTSTATIIALKAARDRCLDFRSRTDGLGGAKLVGYTSAEAHNCVGRAFDMLGLGTDALRKIPVNERFEMDVSALEAQIAEDRAAGLTLLCIVGTAGTVNTGAIDDIEALADIAARESIWLHVDGAFGACGRLSPQIAPRLTGIARADSLAFDFHKWMHVNYDAGCVLVRDANAHLRAFTNRPHYLSGAQEGLAAGAPWPVDLGPELSRGFRALRIWAQIAEHGGETLGRLMDQNCALARYLADKVDATPGLERLSPPSLQICCFRAKPAAVPDDRLDGVNEQIVIRLQMEGLAAPSTTHINGKLAIRVNITNHRTRREDIDLLVEEVLRLSESLTA